MKVTIQAELLQKKLSFLSHFVSAKPQLPILSSLHLVAKDNVITLSATDLEIGLQTTVTGNILEEGKIAIPARTFIELIGSLSKEELTLESTEDSLKVTTPSSTSTFTLFPENEFPKLYEDIGELFCSLERGTFITTLEHILFAASTDTGKPAYSGMLLRGEEGESKKGFLLVATDGFRLSLSHLTSEDTTKVTTSLIIPSRVLKEVTLLKEENGTIEIFTSPSQNQIIFKFADTYIIGRLVASEYPPFERIIPSDFSTQAQFKREEFLKAVRICSIFARDSANVIKLSLQDGKVTVSSQGTTAGDNHVTIDAVIKGEENEIAFNARYLLDFLSNVTDEELVFEMVGPLNPGVFKIKDNPSFLHIIMPIMLQG